MAIINNKQGAFNHIAHYGLKQAIVDIARENTGISHLQIMFDREQKAKIHNANSSKKNAGLTYVSLAKVGASEQGKNYDFGSQKLSLAIAKVIASKKYGVDYINGYLVIEGTTVPPARPSVEPIQVENFSFEPTKAVVPAPEKADEKQAEEEQEKPKKSAKK